MVKNLFEQLAATADHEQFDDVLSLPGLRIERIVSFGQVSPPDFWYEQHWDEWVLLLQGEAQLRLATDDRQITLGPGDHCWLPAGCRHRVEFTALGTPTVWLAVHRDPSR